MGPKKQKKLTDTKIRFVIIRGRVEELKEMCQKVKTLNYKISPRNLTHYMVTMAAIRLKL